MHLAHIPNPPSKLHQPPLPPTNRYVTDRPELPCRVLNRFRARPDRGPPPAATADHLGMAAAPASQPPTAAAAVASAHPPFPGLAVVAPCVGRPLGGGAVAIDPARCLEIFGITHDGDTDGDGGGGSSSSAVISCISNRDSHCPSTSQVGSEAGPLASSLPLLYEDKAAAPIDGVDTPLWDPDWELHFEDWDCDLVEG